MLRRDLETGIELYLQCGRTELAARFASQIKLIDLLVQAAREDMSTHVDDLEQIALHYEVRGLPGDSSQAHRYRQHAQVVAERRAAKLAGRSKANYPRWHNLTRNHLYSTAPGNVGACSVAGITHTDKYLKCKFMDRIK